MGKNRQETLGPTRRDENRDHWSRLYIVNQPQSLIPNL